MENDNDLKPFYHIYRFALVTLLHLSPTYERDNGQDKVEGGVHPQDVDVQVHRVQPEQYSTAKYSTVHYITVY